MKYVILSLQHSTKDTPVFWKANDAGYTQFPFNAGIYTQEQIDRQPHYYNDGKETIALSLTDETMHTIGFQCIVDFDAAKRLWQTQSEKIKPRPPVTEVRIIAENQCEIHGWTVGGVYKAIPGDINVPDDNGQEIYVMSITWNHRVYLSSIEYELVTPVQA